ncbi:CdvA-like protein [Candidatus Bathyarchaeota archaeon]|nr:CdvA-like protein [Candidatus Bathyarchaeota archaeon]
MKQLAESELRCFLGKGATDPYGRNLGRIIGITLNSYGEMEAVEVEKGVGELDRIPAERLSLDGEKIVVIPKWKIEVESLIKEVDSAQRRLSALNTLLRNQEIPQSLYDELSRKQKEELDELRAKKNTAIDILKSRGKELDTQLEELTRLLIEIRAGGWSRDFSVKAYDLASGSIEPNLDFAAKEKRELTDSLAKLTRIL